MEAYEVFLSKIWVYSEAQVAEVLKNLKLLKAAPTRWLSHGEAIDRFIRLGDYEGSKTKNNGNL